MLKKKLTEAGFPVKEKLGPILAPLIEEHHGDIRERLYPPEMVVFAMDSTRQWRDAMRIEFNEAWNRAR